MKIKKFGKVVITEDNIVVTGFHVDGGIEGGFGTWALRWAARRVDEKIAEIRLSVLFEPCESQIK